MGVRQGLVKNTAEDWQQGGLEEWHVDGFWG